MVGWAQDADSSGIQDLTGWITTIMDGVAPACRKTDDDSQQRCFTLSTRLKKNYYEKAMNGQGNRLQ